MNYRFHYQYTDLKPGSSNQYLDKGIDLSRHSHVDAIYVQSFIPEYVGNPLIEALPLPLEDNEIRNTYTKTIKGYDPDVIKNMTQTQRLLSLSQLKKIRMQLPFHKSLEQHMMLALFNSYSDRYIGFNETPKVLIHTNGESQMNHFRGDADSESATNSGFSVLGYSGSGKTSAIKDLTDHYSQVIHHHPDEDHEFVQIVYLVVNCVANSNFNGLYKGIARAIDQALGNTDNYYENILTKAVGLERKQQIIRQLIEDFFIGIIIFDEIQLLNFQGNKENTYKSLLNLSNMTNVSLGVIGTEDAFHKMFPELYTGRRVGTTIQTTGYCESRKFCDHLLDTLFRYQWTENHLELTDDISKTFFEITKGIVDQIVSLYFYVQYDYILKKKKPEFTPDYIRSVFQKYFPGLSKLLENLEDPAAELARHRMMRDSREYMDMIVNKAQQEDEMSKILNENSSADEENRLKEEIIENIQMFYDDKYSELVILEAIESTKKSTELSRDNRKVFLKAVISVLKDSKPKKTEKKAKKDKKPKPTIDLDTLKNYVDDALNIDQL